MGIADVISLGPLVELYGLYCTTQSGVLYHAGVLLQLLPITNTNNNKTKYLTSYFTLFLLTIQKSLYFIKIVQSNLFYLFLIVPVTLLTNYS